MSEINPRFKAFGNTLVVSKLFAIVRCNSMRSIYQWLQEIYHSITYRLRRLAFYLAQKCQAGFALCKGHDSLTMSFSDNRIYFPIAQSLTSIDDARPLIDAHPVRQLSTPIIASITLPALLLAAQVPVEISSSEFVRQDVLVDPLMTDLKAIVVLEPARHLLRTQVKADQSFDQSPGRRIDARFGSPLSSHSHAMGLLGPVASQSSIAPELATDRGLMSTNRVGNLSLLMTCFLKSVYLVSLPKVGKLCVGSHTVPVLFRCQCSFDWSV